MKKKTFVVSLLGSQDRRNHIDKMMREIKWPFEFFDAVDGRKLDPANHPDVHYPAVLEYPQWLTPTMIGCGLSHVNICRRIIEEGLDYAIVFEDDIILSDPFIRLTKHIENYIKPDQKQSILLYYQSKFVLKLPAKKASRVFGDYFLYSIGDSQQVLSTAGYIITREAARSLVENHVPLKVSPDSWQYFVQNGFLNELQVVHPFVTSTYNFRSTITNMEMIGRNRFIGKVTRLVEELKIPILYGILTRRRSRIKGDQQKIEILDN